MKNYSHHTATRLVYKSKILNCFILFFCLFQVQVSSQVSRTFTDDLVVSEGVILSSNLPSSINIRMHGTMNSNNTKDRYAINGKNDEPRLNIHKDLVINTWAENRVRQETTITIRSSSDAVAQKLLDALELSLTQGPDNRVNLDCNLNIESFEMRNGWLKADECKIKLSNGQVHSIDYLELSTKLSIPKSSNLAIVGKQLGTVRLGELDGDLDLELKYVEVYGTKVKDLRASLRSCYNVHFDEVQSANVSSSNSYVRINKAKEIKIGSQALNDACNLPQLRHRRSNSAQTKYTLGEVGRLSLNGSANDEVSIETVQTVNISNTSYTDFTIDKLSESLWLDSKSSDLTIYTVDKNFQEVTIINSLSNIDLEIEEGANYQLAVDRSKLVETRLPKAVEALRVMVAPEAPVAPVAPIEPATPETPAAPQPPFGSSSSVDGTEKGPEVYLVGKGKGDDKGGIILLDCDKCKFRIR